MGILVNNTQKITSYTFALALTDAVDVKNTHDQLYDALALTGGDWYQAKENEPRCIQFIKKAGFLICRSTRQPPSGIALEEVISVSNGDYLQIDVRLPKSRRTNKDHPRGQGKTVALHDHEKIAYFTEILNRHGVGVLSLSSKPAYSSNIFFKAGNSTVNIATCDVTATVKVTDAKAFVAAYAYGVGRYKTYGCGMLNVTKIEG